MLIDFFDKNHDKVNQFMLIIQFSMKIGDQKAEIKARKRLTAENDERFGALGEKTPQSANDHHLHLIVLPDLDADAHRVDGPFDQYSLSLIALDGHWNQKDLWVFACFHFGFVVSFGSLPGEVLKADRGCELCSHCRKVIIIASTCL